MKWAEEVRQAMAELGPATVRHIAARLDIPAADYAGRQKVRLTVRDLVAARLAAPAGQSGREIKYRLLDKTGARGEAQEKVWYAIRLKEGRGETFTIRDIAVLTGYSPDYLKKYLHFLLEGGWIIVVARAKVSLFGVGFIYRLAPGKDQEKPPKWNRRAEEAKRRADVSPASVPLVIAALAKGVEETMQTFASGLRAALAAHNDRVEQVLQEMEADVARIAGPEREVEDAPESSSPDES